MFPFLLIPPDFCMGCVCVCVCAHARVRVGTHLYAVSEFTDCILSKWVNVKFSCDC